MYFAPDGPWAEPNSRGARFFPRIRPTFHGRGYGRGERAPGRDNGGSGPVPQQ